MTDTTFPMGEEQEVSLAHPEFIERVLLFFTFLSSTIALLIGFVWMGSLGRPIAVATGILCLVGLFTSHVLKMLISDFYRSFQYREKFLLFIFHAAIVICPYFFLQFDSFGKPAAFTIVLSILMCVLCFQCIDKIFFARVFAVQFLIIVISCFFFESHVSTVLVFVWFAFVMAGIRFTHLAYRLEEFGDGRGMELAAALRGGFPTLFGCMLAGGGAWWLARRYLHPFGTGVSLPTIDVPPGAPITVSAIYWRAFALFVMIVSVLVLLKWIDQKFSRKKGPAIPADAAIVAGTKVYEAAVLLPEPLEVETVRGPRERILSTFKSFNDRLRTLDLQRTENETVHDYFSRLERMVPAFSALDVAGAPPFDKACYDSEEPTGAEADSFVELLNAKIRAASGADRKPV